MRISQTGEKDSALIKTLQDISAEGKRQRSQIGDIIHSRDRYEKGLIRATSQQGNKLYCIVQREQTLIYDDKDLPQLEKEKYFGNDENLPLDELTLSELLIESNLDLSTLAYEPDDWIGREVLVWIVESRPIMVMIGHSSAPSRIINPDVIKAARALNKKEGLSSSESRKFLLSLGYSTKQVDAVLKETMEIVKPLGTHITYGNTAVWGFKVPDTGSTNIEDSLEAGIVTNLPKALLSNKLCYKPAIVFTAR